MTRGHLSTDRLLTLYRGDIEDFAALEHLASCSRCRRAFDDSRWFLLLRRLPALVAAGPHPDTDQLAAYQTHALSSPRIAEVERHLRSCEVCLARAGRARMAEQRTAYRSPAPASVRRAMKQFRLPPWRRLGSLLVTGLDKGPIGLIFLPEPVAGWIGSTMGVRRGIIEPPHPSDLTQYLDDDLASEALADAGAPLSEDGGTTTPEPLRVPAEGWELVFVPSREKDRARLSIQLIATDEDRSTARVRIRVRDAEGDKAAAVTDDEGRASLPIGPGKSEITIEVEPRLVLRVDVPL